MHGTPLASTGTPAARPAQAAAEPWPENGGAISSRWRLRSSAMVPLAVIAGAVLLANLGELLHLVTTNPLVLDAYLAPRTPPGVLPGLPYIDPNAGFTTQALGHLAALDWLHGHVPWWNPFEGIGSPLAGEMQSGAFFPPTLLLALHDGLLYLQILLEVVAGWATYSLARTIGVGRTAATAAGVAFALCGTFAWFAHAPFRPVAFLPLALVGVERARRAACRHRRGGWSLLAVALALSLLAGFPETALIDGVLVVIWAIVRASDTGRPPSRSYTTKLLAGGAIGAALAAPLLVAFVTYLPSAYVGAHSGALADAALPASGLPQVILPYSLGPIFAFTTSSGPVNTLGAIWGSVGGFLSATLIAGALAGLVGRRYRALRCSLGAWVAICLLRTYGFRPIVDLMAHLPGVPLTAFFRYANPSWTLAVVVLAALGLDDIARNATRPRVMTGAALVAGALSIWAAVAAWPLLSDATGPGTSTTRHAYTVASLVGALVLLTALAIGSAWAGHRRPGARSERTRRSGRVVMAAAVAAESIALFGFTALSAPPPTALVTTSVHWLQAHLGTARFTTLGPIQANYGSYFGISQLDVIDLPIPKAYTDYWTSALDPNTPHGILDPDERSNPAGPTAAAELTRHLAHFEELGVRYVVTNTFGSDIQGHPWPLPGTAPWPAGPRLVEHDRLAEIWELPHPSPIFTTRAARSGSAHCVTHAHGSASATVNCAGPAVLVRRVQYLAGWSATVDGRSVAVQPDRSGPAGLFQQIAVPAGASDVRFTYLPPHEHLAIALALIALALLLGVPIRASVAEHRR